jgi:L-ascorbate metabolism protein UlaG (beta-lactamase superfamily)
MQVEYFGGNCVRISTKKVAIVSDDNLKSLGQKSITKPNDISIITNRSLIKETPEAQFVVDRPGEYEVSDVSLIAVAARAHTDEESQHNANVVRLVVEDIKVCIIGHIHPELSEEQLEAIGMVDVLVIPVGGSGYTLDSIGAIKMIKKIVPKIVIPTHFADSKLKYEVPQSTFEEALKGLAMEPADTLDVLKIKGREFEEGTRLIVLNRQ